MHLARQAPAFGSVSNSSEQKGTTFFKVINPSLVDQPSGHFPLYVITWNSPIWKSQDKQANAKPECNVWETEMLEQSPDTWLWIRNQIKCNDSRKYSRGGKQVQGEQCNTPTYTSASSEQSGAFCARARHRGVFRGSEVVFVPSYNTNTTQSCFRKRRWGGIFYRASTRNGGNDNISVFKEMNLHDFEYSERWVSHLISGPSG